MSIYYPSNGLISNMVLKNNHIYNKISNEKPNNNR